MVLFVTRHGLETVLAINGADGAEKDLNQGGGQQTTRDRSWRSHDSSSGAKPRRRQFSVMTRGTRKFWRYSRPPAFVPPPLILKPPKGCRSTKAPVIGRLIYKLPQINSARARSMFTGL